MGGYRGDWRNALQRMGRTEAAEVALRAALEVDPSNLGVYDALARLLRESHEFAAEIALYGEVLERNENRGPFAAPQGLYPCATEGRYVAIPGRETPRVPPEARSRPSDS